MVIDGIYPNLHVLERGNSSQLATGYTMFDWSGGVWMFGSAVVQLGQSYHTNDPPVLLLRTNSDTSVNVRWYANNGTRLTGEGYFNQIVLLWSKGYGDPLFFEWVLAGRAAAQDADYGLEVRDANNNIVYHSALNEVIYLGTSLANIKRWRAAWLDITHDAPTHYPDQTPWFVGGTGAYVDGWNRSIDSSTNEGFTVLFSSGVSPLTSLRASWQQFTWNSGSGMPGWGGTDLPDTSGYTQLYADSTTTLTVPVAAVVCEVPPA